MALSVSFDLVSSSARVTSVKSAQVSRTYGHPDPTIGPQAYLGPIKKVTQNGHFSRPAETDPYDNTKGNFLHTRMRLCIKVHSSARVLTLIRVRRLSFQETNENSPSSLTQTQIRRNHSAARFLAGADVAKHIFDILVVVKFYLESNSDGGCSRGWIFDATHFFILE